MGPASFSARGDPDTVLPGRNGKNGPAAEKTGPQPPVGPDPLGLCRNPGVTIHGNDVNMGPGQVLDGNGIGKVTKPAEFDEPPRPARGREADRRQGADDSVVRTAKSPEKGFSCRPEGILTGDHPPGAVQTEDDHFLESGVVFRHHGDAGIASLVGMPFHVGDDPP